MVHTCYIKSLEKRENLTYGLGYYATEFIAIGTLVLIEHVFSGSLRDAVRYINHDQEAWKGLYPRQSNDIHEKVWSNAFGNDKSLIIGASSSVFNHACSPNTLHCNKMTGQGPVKRNFNVFFTCKNVQKNEQLFFAYNADAGHGGYNFLCPCNATVVEREKRQSVISKLSDAMYDDIFDQVSGILDQYIGSDIEKQITRKHHFICSGIIATENDKKITIDAQYFIEEGISIEEALETTGRIYTYFINTDVKGTYSKHKNMPYFKLHN